MLIELCNEITVACLQTMSGTRHPFVRSVKTSQAAVMNRIAASCTNNGNGDNRLSASRQVYSIAGTAFYSAQTI